MAKFIRPPKGNIPRLTTQQGAPVADDQNSLKLGARGPTVVEDKQENQADRAKGKEPEEE